MPDCRHRSYRTHASAMGHLYYLQGVTRLPVYREAEGFLCLTCSRWRIGKPPANRDLQAEKARIAEEGKARLAAVDGRWAE